jgi:hypothetical protein
MYSLFAVDIILDDRGETILVFLNFKSLVGSRANTWLIVQCISTKESSEDSVA